MITNPTLKPAEGPHLFPFPLPSLEQHRLAWLLQPSPKAAGPLVLGLER